MQMWCRLGQVLAAFWGAHLGTDVVQTKEWEFGGGYLGLGGFEGVSPGPRPGAGQVGGLSGAFWGSHLGRDTAQAKVAVWGETQQRAERVLPGHRTSAGQSGGSQEGLGVVSLGNRHGAGPRGSLRGS